VRTPSRYHSDTRYRSFHRCPSTSGKASNQSDSSRWGHRRCIVCEKRKAFSIKDNGQVAGPLNSDAVRVPPQCKKFLELGFSIFPVQFRGKRPLTEHGFKDASNDDQQVLEWAHRWARCNWGIALGKQSGCVVLDFDEQDGVAKFEEQYGKLPVTYTVKTARGVHLYYRLPLDGARTRNFEGGELRSDGAYVVAEGSTHSSGILYECILNVEIAEIPRSVLAQLNAGIPIGVSAEGNIVEL
jgi:Bifunctional DNA primase/polymerase, N-terminal